MSAFGLKIEELGTDVPVDVYGKPLANGVIFLVTCIMLKHTILVFLMQKKKFLVPIKSWILLALLKPDIV